MGNITNSCQSVAILICLKLDMLVAHSLAILVTMADTAAKEDPEAERAIVAGAIRLEFTGKLSNLHYGCVQKTVRRYGKVCSVCPGDGTKHGVAMFHAMLHCPCSRSPWPRSTHPRTPGSSSDPRKFAPRPHEP